MSQWRKKQLISDKRIKDQVKAAGSTTEMLFQQELLSDMISGEDEKSCMQRCYFVIVHLLAWAVSLASIVLGAIAVFFLSQVREDHTSAAVYMMEIMHFQDLVVFLSLMPQTSLRMDLPSFVHVFFFRFSVLVLFDTAKDQAFFYRIKLRFHHFYVFFQI